MHMFYENAAHLLLMMTRVGVAIKAGADCHLIVTRLAEHLQTLTAESRELSHAGAAGMILNDLEKSGSVTCTAKARRKVQAALGTLLGNFLTARGHR
jgi:hypothetical protein